MQRLILCLLSVCINAAEWEEAPFMDNTGPDSLEATHVYGFTLRGNAYAITGILRIEEFDYCGTACMTREDFSDGYFMYDPVDGWTDMGPHPGGIRGYAMGDIMDRGTDDEMLYFGLGQTRVANVNVSGGYEKFPRWGFENGTYEIIPDATTYPRLQDWWSFDGTDWTQLADFPGIGRTHPSVVAVDGQVFVGLGWGELCPTDDTCDNSTVLSPFDDPRGISYGLQDVWIYDVATDSWSEIAKFPYSAHHPFQFTDGLNAFFAGGHSGAQMFDDVHAYASTTDSWVEKAPIPGKGRVAGTQQSHNGYGYVIGGEASTRDSDSMPGFPDSTKYGWVAGHVKEDHRSMETCQVWRYDAASDEWTELDPVPGRSRWTPSSFVLDDYLYVFSGVIRSGHFDYGNYSQSWPQQGYRLYIGDEEEVDGEAMNIEGMVVGLVLAALIVLGFGLYVARHFKLNQQTASKTESGGINNPVTTAHVAQRSPSSEMNGASPDDAQL